MRYAKPSKLSFAVENSTFIEVYIRFSHSVLNFLFQFFLQSQLYALIIWKFLMNMLKKQYLDVLTLQLEKSFVTLAIIIEWVPQKKTIFAGRIAKVFKNKTNKESESWIIDNFKQFLNKTKRMDLTKI